MKTLKILLFAVLFTNTINIYAQFSREDAIDTVMNYVLVEDTSHIDIYCSLDSLSNTDSLIIFAGDTLVGAYSYNWIFYVNDHPFSNWLHDCRYICINTANGSYTIYDKKGFPIDLESDFEAIRTMREKAVAELPSGPAVQIAEPNPHLYAVLICADDINRYWSNTAAIYCTLIQIYGYKKENIFLHYYDGVTAINGNDFDNDGYNDIDYDASIERIEQTFRNLAGEINDDQYVPALGEEDQLFVFVTDHGACYCASDPYIGSCVCDENCSKIILPNRDDNWSAAEPTKHLFDFQMADYVENISCAQMIFVFAQCASGGLKDDLFDYTTYNVECKNRIVHAACDWDEESKYENDVTSCIYDEFVWYWNAAARGYYPMILEPWRHSIYETGNFDFSTIDYSLYGCGTHPGDINNYDSNADGMAQMNEIYEYVNKLDSWTNYPSYQPYWDCHYNYQNDDYETHQYVSEIVFDEDLMTLEGICGEIDNNYTITDRSYLLGGYGLNITSLVDLELSNTEFTMRREQEINIEDEAILNLSSTSSIHSCTCGQEDFEGAINVLPGGHIINGNNSTIDFRGTGIVTVQYALNNSGEIDIYPNSSLLLNDVNTILDVSGTLNIQSNATFTFTGDGYIKFSNPTSEPHNITAGTNSGFVLNGTSAQTDKILEVAQTSIYIPENVATFTINDGLVHMSNNYARIVPEGSNTDITITDVLFSPQSLYRTDHRGLVICGQENVIISGCRFIKGQYGVYAYLSWMGNSLEINTSEFEDNDYGVWENGVSIMLSECTFEDNTYGLYAQATSLDDNSITDCSFTGSNYPVRYISCSGDLLMENSEVNGATSHGVQVSGSHTFTGICNEFINVSNTSCAGIYAASNAIIDLGSTGYGESNYFADNFYHVRFNNANFVYLNYGLNNFYPNSGSKKIYGSLNKYSCGGLTPVIPALNNQWYSTLTNLSSSDYSVYKYNCSPAYYYSIIGTSPTAFEFCFQGLNMLGGSEEPSINESATSSLTSSFQQNINNVFETAETTGNWGDAHDYCWQVFQSPVPTASVSNIDYWDIAWVGLSHCTKKLYSGTNSNANNQTYLAHTFDALEKMKQLQSGNDARLFFLETEKAIFNRLAGDYTTALGILDNIILNTTDSAELAYAERWRCIMQVEQDVKAGNISLSEIQDYTANCALIEGMGTKSLMLANQENNFNVELINIKIVPNPVTAQSEIIVSLPEKTEGKIEITDIHGRNIKSYPAIGNSNISITNNQFPKGIYTVKLISEDGEVKTARMIIQ